MAVSKEMIRNRITTKVITLSEIMKQEFGGDTTNWLKCIQQTDLYISMIDSKTHLWSEGDMYLKDCLMKELRERGVIQ